MFWYLHAESVNTNDIRDPANRFIREAIGAGLSYENAHGVSVQAVSNEIASLAIRHILDSGAILPIVTLLPDDIGSALRVTGGHLGDWGGSFYYWNTPYNGSTIGKIILSDPAEYERFITTAGYALYKTAGQYPANTALNLLIQGLSSFKGDILPLGAAMDVVERAVSLVIGGNAAGNPNHIDGYWYESRNNQWLHLDQSGNNPYQFLFDLTADAAKTAKLNALRQLRLQHQDMFGGTATQHGAVDVGPGGRYAVGTGDGATFGIVGYKSDGTRTITASASADGSLSIAAVAGDILGFGPAARADITGSGFSVALSANDNIKLLGGTNIIVTGDNSWISAGAGVAFSLTGASDAITLAATDTLTLSGIGHSITATGCTIVGNANTSFNVSGANDVVRLVAEADYLGVFGTGHSVNATRCTIAGGPGASLNVSGVGDAINLLAAGEYVGVFGTGHLVTATRCTVAGGAGASFNVSGANDTITLYAAGEYVGVFGTGHSVTATSCTIAGGTGASFNVFGSGNAITLYAAGEYVGVFGTGHSVTATNCTIAGGTGASFNVFGANDAINLNRSNIPRPPASAAASVSADLRLMSPQARNRSRARSRPPASCKAKRGAFGFT